MELLTHNSELNLSTGKYAREHGADHLKTLGFGADLRFYPVLLVGTGELQLPARSIARKQTKSIVQAGVSHIYPAFCTVTASGSNRRPAAGSFFCFGLRRLRLRFPSATDPP